jgi:acetyl-CoA C-acetyltransferase
VHHAGNSSGIVDGASLMLWFQRNRRKIGFETTSHKKNAVIGSEPLIMLEGPIPATKKALRKPI